ncbi:MAG: hypothetical protein Q9174_001246 [Haloplaca sp. 1 TL-2023]
MSHLQVPESSANTSSAAEIDNRPLTGKRESNIIVMFRLIPDEGRAPVPFTYIKNFVNSVCEREWTTRQVVRRYLELRQEYESRSKLEDAGPDPHHAFYDWDQRYKDDARNASLKSHYALGEAAFEEDFAETWSDEADAIVSMKWEKKLYEESLPGEIFRPTLFAEKCRPPLSIHDRYLKEIYKGEGPFWIGNPYALQSTQTKMDEALQNVTDFEKAQVERLQELKMKRKYRVGPRVQHPFYVENTPGV